MSPVYLIRPKADRDLDDQAFYYAQEAGQELGRRFLLAAHETFCLLAEHPQMGWRVRLKHAELTRLRVFRVSGFEKILVLYDPHESGVEILRVVHASRNLLAVLRREGIE